MTLIGAVASFGLGLATGAASIVLHDITWALVLGSAATVLTVWALPAGVRGRVPYALGWMVVLAMAVTPTSGGGYLLGSTTSGYVAMALGLVALSVSIATFPLRRRRRLTRDDESPRQLDDLAG